MPTHRDLFLRCLDHPRESEDFKAIDQHLVKYNKDKKQFLKVEDCNSGYLSPNGVFFPCEVSGHEPFRLYLQKIFSLSYPRSQDMTNHEYEMFCTVEFESRWVKFASDNMIYDSKIMFVGKTLTPRQKLFIEEWVKVTNFNQKDYYLKQIKKDGVIKIGENYILNENLMIKRVKND